MPNNNSPRTPVGPPRGLALPQDVPRRRVDRTPDPVNNLENNNAFRRRNVARALNFNNIPMTPPPQSSRNNNRPLLSPSPRTKKKRLEQVKATNYLAKYKHMLNNNKNYNTINKNTKNFNIEKPVFLLSDVYESRDGKVKIIYSEKYLESAWKNRTIFKSPITGVRTDKELMVRFNPRLHHNKVIATPNQLAKYKDNKNLLIETVGEKTFIERFLVPIIKDKLPYVIKFIKIIHKNHVDFSHFVVEVLDVSQRILGQLHIANIDKLTKKEVDKCIKVYNKLMKQLRHFPMPNQRNVTTHIIYINIYATYLRSKIIHEFGVDNLSLRKFYKDLKEQKDLKNILPMLNLSNFNELKNLI